MSNHRPVGCTGHPQAQTRMPHLESDHPRQMGENGCSDSYCSGLQNLLHLVYMQTHEYS